MYLLPFQYNGADAHFIQYICKTVLFINVGDHELVNRNQRVMKDYKRYIFMVTVTYHTSSVPVHVSWK